MKAIEQCRDFAIKWLKTEVSEGRSIGSKTPQEALKWWACWQEAEAMVDSSIKNFARMVDSGIPAMTYDGVLVYFEMYEEDIAGTKLVDDWEGDLTAALEGFFRT